MSQVKTRNLWLFDDVLQDDIVEKVLYLDTLSQDVSGQEIRQVVNQALINFAEEHGLSGDIWKKYLLWCLIHSKNVFTRLIERKEGRINQTSIYRWVEKDIHQIIEWMDLDHFEDELKQYVPLAPREHQGERAYLELCERVENDMKADLVLKELIAYYQRNGVGIIGRYSAFRWSVNALKPLNITRRYSLDHLVGLEVQKEKLIANTEAFIAGNQANNVLLYGDSGTGKSSSIKGLLNDYWEQGLRMVEVYKHQFQELPLIIEYISRRPYRWVLFFDDLSFEAHETEYKYLKAVFEGSLEEKPNNVLIYATSNRRHLIRETWKDRQTDDDIHRNDTLQEKLSLADRFGLTLMYLTPSQQEYLNIVTQLAKDANITMSIEELHRKALQWELRHGSFSGRVATQFIQQIEQV